MKLNTSVAIIGDTNTGFKGKISSPRIFFPHKQLLGSTACLPFFPPLIFYEWN